MKVCRKYLKTEQTLFLHAHRFGVKLGTIHLIDYVYELEKHQKSKFRKSCMNFTIPKNFLMKKFCSALPDGDVTNA